MALSFRLIALLLWTHGGSSSLGLPHMAQFGSAFALGHSTEALASVVLGGGRGPRQGGASSKLLVPRAVATPGHPRMRAAIGCLVSLHGGGDAEDSARSESQGSGLMLRSAGRSSGGLGWPWTWFSRRNEGGGWHPAGGGATRMHISRKRAMELSAGRGKGGGMGRQKRVGVSYPTSCGWLKQDILVGEERLNEASDDVDEQDYDSEQGGPARPRHQFGGFRYAFRVLYDGSSYCGWQLQHNEPSVQGLLETVLKQKMQSRVKVVGAGRTDTGVHARGQAAHFDTFSKIEDPSSFEHSINRMLPTDVRIRGLQEAPASRLFDNEGRLYQWHSIYNAIGKLYVYRFFTGEMLDPLERHMRHYEHRTIDHQVLLRAAGAFEGTHNFAAFANQNMKGKAGKNPVRTIHSIAVIDEGEGRYRLDFILDGALYKMVRNIVGTMLQVAAGKMAFSAIDELFEEGTRQRVPMAAPAHGLCLEQVFYTDYAGGGKDDVNPPSCLVNNAQVARVPL